MHKNVKYKCLECCKQFSNEDNLALHQKTTSHVGREVVELKEEEEVSTPQEALPNLDFPTTPTDAKLEVVSKECSSLNVERVDNENTKNTENVENTEVNSFEDRTENLFNCENCRKSFLSEGALDIHVKSDHSGEKQVAKVFMNS